MKIYVTLRKSQVHSWKSYSLLAYDFKYLSTWNKTYKNRQKGAIM